MLCLFFHLWKEEETHPVECLPSFIGLLRSSHLEGSIVLYNRSSANVVLMPTHEMENER